MKMKKRLKMQLTEQPNWLIRRPHHQEQVDRPNHPESPKIVDKKDQNLSPNRNSNNFKMELLTLQTPSPAFENVHK